MRKSTRTALIIAAAFVALGLVICTSVFAVTRGEVFELKGYGYTYQEYTCDVSRVRELVVRDSNNKVTLLPAEGGELKVCYYVTDKDYYDISLSEAGRLEVRRVDKKRWLDGFSFYNLQDISLTVYVPSGMLEEISAATSNGNLSMRGISLNGALTLTTSNGGIRAENFEVGGDLTLSTANGTIEISGVDVGGRASAVTSNGRIKAENLSASDIGLENSNGSVTATATAAAGRLRIESSNGAIRVEGVEGRDIELTTGNSDISGSLPGGMSDYAITSRTSNGSNNLPNGTKGERTLVVETSNGSIDIRFEE